MFNLVKFVPDPVITAPDPEHVPDIATLKFAPLIVTIISCEISVEESDDVPYGRISFVGRDGENATMPLEGKDIVDEIPSVLE
jgi:hypothetical protein